MRLNQINFEIITPEKDELSVVNTYSAKHLCLLMYLRVARLSLMYSMTCPRKSSKLSSVDLKYSIGEHPTTPTYELYAPIKGQLNYWLPTQVLVVWVFLRGRRGSFSMSQCRVLTPPPPPPPPPPYMVK